MNVQESRVTGVVDAGAKQPSCSGVGRALPNARRSRVGVWLSATVAIGAMAAATLGVAEAGAAQPTDGFESAEALRFESVRPEVSQAASFRPPVVSVGVDGSVQVVEPVVSDGSFDRAEALRFESVRPEVSQAASFRPPVVSVGVDGSVQVVGPVVSDGSFDRAEQRRHLALAPVRPVVER